MASLLVTEPGQSQRIRSVLLYNRITTLGSDPENDVVLDDPDISAHHAQIVLQKDDFRLTAASSENTFEVNGRAQKDHVLEDGDSVTLGNTSMTFSLYDELPESDSSERDGTSLDGLNQLVAFSDRLMASQDLNALLNELLDGIIDSTNAAKGFLILLDEEEDLHVRAARGLDKATLDKAESALSDSILKKVLETREAVVVSDALNDKEFSASTSVIDLKLCSVMCAPLLARGELLGLIYLGNSNVVNLFTHRSLEVLRIFASQAALLVRNALLLNELEVSNEALREELDTVRFGEIIGVCDSMREIFTKVEKVATADISVLIQGETGTGKELIAHEIHERSNRKKGPFVVINCGAIPENLLESELFGHVRGAFTGAVANKPGRFHAASGGTLFLDELGELPLNLQVKLLRAIQERQVTRLGDTRSENVDIRIVAATNRRLDEEVRAGRFREDLYYRLNVITLHLPPLRERGDDVILIARYLLQKYSAEFNGQAQDFTKACVRSLRKHAWHGNIRELENRIKKAIVFTDGKLVGSSEMDLEDHGLVAHIHPLAKAKEEFQRLYIDKVLDMNDGNRTKTARDLGVDPRTIFRHLEKGRDSDDPVDPAIQSVIDEI
jgi:transcriptional regulator with GAF, ATPase, and Fis domain